MMMPILWTFLELSLAVISHSIGSLLPLMTSKNYLVDALLTEGTQLADSSDFRPDRLLRIKTRAPGFELLSVMTPYVDYFLKKQFQTGRTTYPPGLPMN